VNASTPAFGWRDYLPLAKAETSKFYKKQERSKFSYEELLTVSVEALGTSPGVNYAKKAIRGALTDYARDAYKLVRNIEMSEEEYLRTRCNPAPLPAAVQRVFVLGRVRHTLYTPGPYRSNVQLLVGDGKVGKHGKVSVAIERTTYNDEVSQERSGWICAKIEDDYRQEFDPSTRMAQPRGDVGQADYVGRGREQRWSAVYINAGKEEREESGSGERPRNGKVEITNPNRKPQEVIRRIAAAPPLDLGISGRRTSNIAASMWKFGLEPIPKGKLGHWRKELAMEPRLRAGTSLIAWQREAGYFRPAEVDWSVPDRPTGWGDNWLRAYLDRWEQLQEKIGYLSG
jgi:hypothetical protein